MKTYAITLGFDRDTTDRIQAVIDRIAEATRNDYMISIGISAHVSLGLFEADSESAVAAVVADFAAGIRPFDVTFDSIGSFYPYVMFTSPVKDENLARYNRELHERMQGFRPAENGYYTPDMWEPHCTLATKLDEQQNAIAHAEAEKLTLPFTARAEHIILAECDPYRESARWEFS